MRKVSCGARAPSLIKEQKLATTPERKRNSARTLALLHANPDARERVRADRALVPHAFAESLRVDQPTNLLGRRFARDCELGGERLRAGQGVLLLWASATRDEAEFPNASRFDLDRQPRRSLGFGHGIHKCLGEHRANLEGRVLIEELLALLGRFDLDIGRAERTHGEFLCGSRQLPVTFLPAVFESWGCQAPDSANG